MIIFRACANKPEVSFVANNNDDNDDEEEEEEWMTFLDSATRAFLWKPE